MAKREETGDWQVVELENGHPSAYYTLSAKLFKEGKQEEAVFWFYVGQLRYRFHLAATPGLDPSGDPALFASLSEVVGRPLNEYAFGDIPALAETIDRVLVWDAQHENGFTSKRGHEAVLEQIRDGLRGMKEMIVKERETIAAQRRENGLG